MKEKKNNKRLVTALIVVAALIIGAAVFILIMPKKPKKKRGLTAGMPAVSFVTGIKDGRASELSFLFYRKVIILSFTGKDIRSEKLKTLLSSGFGRIKSAEPKITWIDVSEQSGWFILTEPMEADNGLKYRFPKSALPAIYANREYPAIYLIDRDAVIRMIYRGYSPTAVSDIISALLKK